MQITYILYHEDSDNLEAFMDEHGTQECYYILQKVMKKAGIKVVL